VQAIRIPDPNQASASSDVGDVSWLVPTMGFGTATAVPGTPGHSWQNVACAGSTIGRKGMVNAAKVLALTATDLLTQPHNFPGKLIVVVLPDSGERYLTSILFDHLRQEALAMEAVAV